MNPISMNISLPDELTASSALPPPLKNYLQSELQLYCTVVGTSFSAGASKYKNHAFINRTALHMFDSFCRGFSPRKTKALSCIIEKIRYTGIIYLCINYNKYAHFSQKVKKNSLWR